VKDAASPAGFGGTLVVADHQTSGHGRMNRKWVSPAGQNLLFSLVLTHQSEAANDQFLNTLALSTPLAVRAAIAAMLPGASVNVKYPNDVLVSGAKCSGILIQHGRGSEQSSPISSWFVAGVGINVNHAPGPECDNITYPVTSIASALGGPADRLVVLQNVLENLQLFLAMTPEVLADHMRVSCETLGKFVTVTTPSGPISGTALSISRDGGLILREESGAERLIYSGDVLGQ
jgi:BirA family biotin operon repressor/biotin-[acetyl-CoA-carboxylase] ligase